MRDLIEDRGCKLEFLPLYSPDYNPIEFSFSVIKSTLKSSVYQLARNENIEELAAKLKEAIADKITPEVTKSHFQHCRIRI
jgi:transposase